MTGVSSQYPSHLLARSVANFEKLLQMSAKDDKRWKKTVAGISRQGLLSITLTVKHESRVPVIDTERLEHDRRYRRQISQALSKPLAPTTQTADIPLERARLSDPAYMREMSGILAHRWNQKILAEQPDVVTQLTLLHVNTQILSECLEKLYLHEMTATNVSKIAMKQFANEAIDADPEVQKIFSKLNTACDAIEDRFNRDVDLRLQRIQEDTRRRLDEIVARCKSRGAEPK